MKLKGSRSGVLAECFLEAWGSNTQKPLPPCRFRRQSQTTTCFLKLCGFLALAPQASKKPLGPRNHYAIPLGYRRVIKRPGRDCSSPKGQLSDEPLFARPQWPGLRGSSSSSSPPKSPAPPGNSADRRLMANLGA